MNGSTDACPAAARRSLYATVLQWQDAFTSIERCTKPVIAAIDGVCIGAGVDLICACDIRYQERSAWLLSSFKIIKENRLYINMFFFSDKTRYCSVMVY